MQKDSYTVALVEDEAVLRQEMAFQLGHMGFAVETFEAAPALYRHLATRPRAIVVLDIGLPGEDGLSVCRYLRAHDAQLGIVLLTARGLRDDRLQGLADGADAYLVKPVDMDELALVLRRLGARFAALKAAPAVPEAATGGWSTDDLSGHLIAPNGARLRLSVNEGQVLRQLMDKTGAVCRPIDLALAMGLHPDELDRHRLEVIISRLRSKVVRECGLHLPLRAVRNQGYLLDTGAGGA